MPNQTPAEVHLHFRAQRTQDGPECVSIATGYKVVSQFARELRADGAVRQGQLTISPSMILKGHQEQTFKAQRCPDSEAVSGGRAEATCCAGWRACPVTT